MIPLRRHPGEGRSSYQRRIATTRALEAFVERVKTDPVHAEITRLDAGLRETARMMRGGIAR